MKLLIGENIKRLRRMRGITQEQLANLFNVSCAAISKWENGDTYPDMTMIFPLCHYFNVSVDELMGYDVNLIENEIIKIISDYQNLLCNFQYEEAEALIREAYKKYPNDYKIMGRYLLIISGGLADNDPEVLKNNADEINRICEAILSGSNDERLRLDAITIKAKLLHAKGFTKEALSLLNTFPSFYHSSGQRIEQLFAKDTDEFHHQLLNNMYELADFTANKIAKAIFYDKHLTKHEKKAKVLKIGKTFAVYHNDKDFDVFILLALMFWGESRGKAVLLEYDEEFIINCCYESYKLADLIDKLIQDNLNLKTYINNNRVIKTEGNYLHNYISYNEKCLPLAIVQSEKYKQMLNQFK